MSDLEQLAATVEALSGPCRETDFLIAEAVSDIPEHWAGCRVRQDRPWEFADERDVWPTKWEGGQPAYTASIDAAMTLVPEGCGWIAGWGQTTPDEPMGGALITRHARFAGYDVANDPIAEADAATPALALCAASLRARKGEG